MAPWQGRHRNDLQFSHEKNDHSMLDMNAPVGARPGAPWSWIRTIVILALGAVAYLLCAREGPVLALGAGGTLMVTLHGILPKPSKPASDDEGPEDGPLAGNPG